MLPWAPDFWTALSERAKGAVKHSHTVVSEFFTVSPLSLLADEQFAESIARKAHLLTKLALSEHNRLEVHSRR